MAQFSGGRWAYRAEKERQAGESSRQERRLLHGLGKSILDMGTTLGVEYAKWKMGGEDAAKAKLTTADAADRTSRGDYAKALAEAKKGLASAGQLESATVIGEKLYGGVDMFDELPVGLKGSFGGLAFDRQHKPVTKSKTVYKSGSGANPMKSASNRLSIMRARESRLRGDIEKLKKIDTLSLDQAAELKGLTDNRDKLVVAIENLEDATLRVSGASEAGTSRTVSRRESPGADYQKKARLVLGEGAMLDENIKSAAKVLASEDGELAADVLLSTEKYTDMETARSVVRRIVSGLNDPNLTPGVRGGLLVRLLTDMARGGDNGRTVIDLIKANVKLAPEQDNFWSMGFGP